MSDTTSPLGVINTCAECGVQFAIHKDVESNWRTSHKVFYCPNGHGLSWKGPTPQEEEITKLKARVKDLETLLKAATDQAAASMEQVKVEKNRVAELTARLEIWEPAPNLN